MAARITLREDESRGGAGLAAGEAEIWDERGAITADYGETRQWTPTDVPPEAATTPWGGSRSTRCLHSPQSTVGRERDRGVNTYSGKRKYRSFVISFLPEKTHGEGK